LDAATGNTEPGKNDGTVYFDYTACDGTPSTRTLGVAMTFTNDICVQADSMIVSYYYANNAIAFGGSSFATDTGTPCS
jgi:hypothetical protein